MPPFGSRLPVSGESAKSPWDWWGTPPGFNSPITWVRDREREGEWVNKIEKILPPDWQAAPRNAKSLTISEFLCCTSLRMHKQKHKYEVALLNHFALNSGGLWSRLYPCFLSDVHYYCLPSHMWFPFTLFEWSRSWCWLKSSILQLPVLSDTFILSNLWISEWVGLLWMRCEKDSYMCFKFSDKKILKSDIAWLQIRGKGEATFNSDCDMLKNSYR